MASCLASVRGVCHIDYSRDINRSMLSYVLLVLTVWRCGGVDGQATGAKPHIHHGVERADVWGDVWVVNLRSGIDPQV